MKLIRSPVWSLAWLLVAGGAAGQELRGLDPEGEIARTQPACGAGDVAACRRFVAALAAPGFDFALISELALRGILKTPEGFIALAEDEQGAGHVLHAGSRVFDGTVTAIDTSAVTFRQEVADPLAPEKWRDVAMPLYHPQAEAARHEAPIAPAAPVTLRRRGTRLGEVLGLLGAPAGATFEIAPGLDVAVDVDATDVPWSRVLHDLAVAHGFGYVGAGAVIRVGRPADLRSVGGPYTGEPLSFDFVRASLADVLRLFADVSGLNVIAPADAETTLVTVRVQDLPWDEVMDLVLDACGLGVRLDGNVAWIVPRAEVSAAAVAGRWSRAPVSLSLREADLRQVLALLGGVLAVHVEVDPRVEGRLTLNLYEVPGDQLLALLLERNALVAVAKGDRLDVLRKTDAPPAATPPTFAEAVAAAAAARAAKERDAGTKNVEETRQATLRRLLPAAPDPDPVETVRAAIGGDFAALDARAGAPPVPGGLTHVAVDVEGVTRWSDVRALPTRLDDTLRLLDVARLRLAPAAGGRVRVAATVRVHHRIASNASAADDARQIQWARSEAARVRRFLAALATLASVHDVRITEASYDASSSTWGAVQGRIPWPGTARDVERVFVEAEFEASLREGAREGACHGVNLSLGVSRDEQAAVEGSGDGDPFAGDDPCIVDREAAKGLPGKPDALALHEFELAGIEPAGPGWSALAYDPRGRLLHLGEGQRLKDARIAVVGPSHLVVDTDVGARLRFNLPHDPPPIRLAHETTRVRGPILPDGAVDYGALLNARFGAGATPESNAAPLVDAVFRPDGEGPRFVGGVDPTSYGEYQRTLGGPTASHAAFLEEWRRASVRPWSEAQCPLVATWLGVNEPALAALAEASLRPRYFVPFPEGESVATVTFPTLVPWRNAGNALKARGLLRLGRMDVAGAAADVLALHRLAGLLAQGSLLIDHLVAAALRGLANEPLVSLAARATPEQAKALAAELARLPEFPPLVDTVDVTERYGQLAGLMHLRALGARRGPAAWGEFLDPFGAGSPSVFFRIPVPAYDWDEALRLTNRLYDAQVAVLRATTAAERAAGAARFEAEWKELEKEVADVLGPLGEDALEEPHPRPDVRRALGRALAMKDWHSPYRASVPLDEAHAGLRLGRAALALRAWRAGSARFPAGLDSLVPTDRAACPEGTLDRHVYRYAPSADGRRFAYVATPETPGETGVRTLCVDDSGRLVAASDLSGPPHVDGRCVDPVEERLRAVAPALLEKARARVQQTEASVRRLEDLMRETAEVDRKREIVHRLLPESLDVEALLRDLKGAAAGTGVRMAFRGMETEWAAGHQVGKVIVRIVGPRDALEAFLPRIPQMARLLRVAERRDTEGGADLTLHTFAAGAEGPPVSRGCLALDTGQSLLDCCAAVGASGWTGRPEGLGGACRRLLQLQAVLRRVDDLAWKRDALSRRIALFESLQAGK